MENEYENITEQQVQDGASFDGILDGFTGFVGDSGFIGLIIAIIIGFIALRKFKKSNKKLAKTQKESVQEYKEHKKESLVEIKQIDKKSEQIIKEIIENNKKEEDIKLQIADDIIQVVDNIEKTKIEEKRTVADTNGRLKRILEKTKNRNK